MIRGNIYFLYQNQGICFSIPCLNPVTSKGMSSPPKDSPPKDSPPKDSPPKDSPPKDSPPSYMQRLGYQYRTVFQK